MTSRWAAYPAGIRSRRVIDRHNVGSDSAHSDERRSSSTRAAVTENSKPRNLAATSPAKRRAEDRISPYFGANRRSLAPIPILDKESE
jgi:hypothetical protein